MNRIYFDHSATTPVEERVVVAMNEFMLDKFGNPSSIHSFGRDAKNALETARISIANLVNCPTEDLYFTSGGTEADNLALLGYVIADREEGNHIVVSNVEHPAIRKAADELERLGFTVSRVQADKFGQVHPDTIEEVLSDETLLVSVMHVNNEVGTINDIAAIAEIVHEHGAIFHTDAVQSFGKIAIDAEKMNIDMISVSSHKIYGPKGVGALYVRGGIDLAPRTFGGKQEIGMRVGTENMPGIVGFGKAAEICADEMNSEAGRLTELRTMLHTTLKEEIDNIHLNGHPIRRLPGNLNLTFRGIEGEALLMALDLEGIAVSSGSACSSGNTDPSPILLALGLSPEDAQASLRITLGRSNTISHIQHAARVIIDTVDRLRSMAGE